MKLDHFFSNYFTVRAELLEAVGNLTPEQLAWKAPRHPNMIGSLLAHIAETEFWWISVVACQKVTDVDWGRFDGTRPLTELLDMLEETFDDTSEFLRSNTVEDWDKVFYSIPRGDEKVSMRWLIWHVVEHQARHRGQIFMLMRMQGIDVPNV